METQQKLTSLITAHEVQIHYKRPVFNVLPKVSSSKDTDKLLRNYIDLNRIDLKEFFWVLLLNNAHKVIGLAEISSGNDSNVTVNIKEIFQLIIKTNASIVILSHNHPSGNLSPSQADKKLTDYFISLANVLNVLVVDHLIITSESYYSFADNGLIG